LSFLTILDRSNTVNDVLNLRVGALDLLKILVNFLNITLKLSELIQDWVSTLVLVLVKILQQDEELVLRSVASLHKLRNQVLVLINQSSHFLI
jgi:hypothetical protein